MINGWTLMMADENLLKYPVKTLSAVV